MHFKKNMASLERSGSNNLFSKVIDLTITLYARQQRRHRCIELSFGLCEEGEGGMIWENGIETRIISYMK